ncbi:MAG: hypothetical protein LQ342_007232 [Letrouitia transgressa]|nr:MAG: hypothetical protein LQ342_007232 [Letrouitia transgressa]
MENYDTYRSPLEGRYATPAMKELFSPLRRASKWRSLWLWLAESQKELGLQISDKAIQQMSQNIEMTEKDFEIIKNEERKRRHDVRDHDKTNSIAERG